MLVLLFITIGCLVLTALAFVAATQSASADVDSCNRCIGRPCIFCTGGP